MKSNILKSFCFLFLLTIISSCSSDEKKAEKEKLDPSMEGKFLDEKAETLLDGMVAKISSLTSCSFTVYSSEKLISGEFEPTKEVDVYLKGADKMYIHSIGEKGENAYWYNGEYLSYYSFTHNVFDSIPGEGSSIEIMDQVHHDYGIKFPAADFLYPTLTDDLIAFSDSVLYIGDTVINNKNLSVVLSKNSDLEIYIFIDVESELPAGMFVRNKKEKEVYKSVIKNWKVNPQLEDVMFKFSAPSDAERKIIEKKNS